MGIETEFEFDMLSPEYYSDSVSDDVTDETLITQSLEEGENETVLPDAIQIISDEEETSSVEYEEVPSESNLSMDQVDSPALASDHAEEWSDLLPRQTENQSDPQTNDSSEELDNETIGKIYKLLDERIPEQKTGESESESEFESESESESEVSLQDLKIILENIESYESEQLSGISTVNDNIINSINNDYHISMYEIGILSAILGSLAVNALFRKIL